MATKIIHSISPVLLKVGEDVRTRCGRVASVELVGGGVARMIASTGSIFVGSTQAKAVTCKKCLNLLTTGMLHERSRRTSGPALRPVVTVRSYRRRAA